MNAPLNLASRPFRNEKLPALLLALGWMALVVLTAVHVLAVRRLLPANTGALHQDVASLEQRLTRLDVRQAGLRRDVDKATLEDWLLVKELVDRRALSWTELLAALERVMPAGVRITSLSPAVKDGRVVLSVETMVRSSEDALEFARRLEDRPEFDRVYPLNVNETPQGRRTQFRMFYDPPAPGSAAAAPDAEAQPAEGEPGEEEPS